MSLRNDMTKHRIFVQRLAGTEFNSIKGFLALLEKQAKIEISAATIGKTLKTRLRATMENLSSIAIDNMTDVATYESKFSAKVFNRYFDGDIKAVDTDALRLALIKTNMAINNINTKSDSGVQKLTTIPGAKKKSLGVAYDQFGQRKADEITQVIIDAQLLQSTEEEIVKLVQERIAGLQTAQARTLATTAINYTTNVAKSETISENSEIIKKEVWISALEESTCGYCEDQHDTVYDEGEAPDCPAHWNCMCEVIPYEE